MLQNTSAGITANRPAHQFHGEMMEFTFNLDTIIVWTILCIDIGILTGGLGVANILRQNQIYAEARINMQADSRHMS